MRNVVRLEEPKLLKQKAARWTQDLLVAIDAARRGNGKVSQTLWNRYNRKTVRERLKTMYSGLCCYCESRIGDVAHSNIEHRKPKHYFPESTFSWDNLHLACPKCNTAKSDKWDSDNEILDAVSDCPMSRHLTYDVIGAAVTRTPITNRGAVTIDHADLNRHELVQTRRKMFLSAFDTVTKIRDKERVEGDSPMVKTARKELQKLFSDEHGSVIEFLASKVLNRID